MNIHGAPDYVMSCSTMTAALYRLIGSCRRTNADASPDTREFKPPQFSKMATKLAPAPFVNAVSLSNLGINETLN